MQFIVNFFKLETLFIEKINDININIVIIANTNKELQQTHFDWISSLFYELPSLSERLELVDVDEQIHGVFAENIVSDHLTQFLLPLGYSGSRDHTESPLRLVDLLPGRLTPQLGSDEAEQGGEKPLGGLTDFNRSGIMEVFCRGTRYSMGMSWGC